MNRCSVTFLPDREDIARERRIDGHYRQMMAATTYADRRKHYEYMRAEVMRRSPAQVERMERGAHVRENI